jgi:hypothetical protein
MSSFFSFPFFKKKKEKLDARGQLKLSFTFDNNKNERGYARNPST